MLNRIHIIIDSRVALTCKSPSWLVRALVENELNLDSGMQRWESLVISELTFSVESLGWNAVSLVQPGSIIVIGFTCESPGP